MNDIIINGITDYVFISDEPRESDIIFLPGGTYAEVPEKGALLYKAGLAPILLPSGMFSVTKDAFTGVSSKGDIYKSVYDTECDFYTEVLIRNGVPASAILRESRARYTMQNAVFSKEVCDAADIKVRRALICCKSYHARRCLVYYAAAFPDAELSVCPTDCAGIGRDNWYKSEKGFDTVMSEVEKTGAQAKETLQMYVMSFWDN